MRANAISGTVNFFKPQGLKRRILREMNKTFVEHYSNKDTESCVNKHSCVFVKTADKFTSLKLTFSKMGEIPLPCIN